MAICECTNCYYPETVLTVKWVCKECFTENDTVQTTVPGYEDDAPTVVCCDECDTVIHDEDEMNEFRAPHADLIVCDKCLPNMTIETTNGSEA